MVAAYGGTTPISRLGDLFSVLAGWGLEIFLDTKSAKQDYEKLRCEHKEKSQLWQHLQADPDKDIFLSLREPDLKKAARMLTWMLAERFCPQLIGWKNAMHE